jgi:hypothetical protein
VAAEEGLEDLVALCGGDARTAIRHNQFHFVVRRDAGRDVNRCVRRRVLDRVLQEICQNALHLADVDTHGRQVGGHVAPHDTLSERAAHSVDGAVDDRRGAREGQVRVGRDKAVGATSFKQRLDKFRHSIGLELDLRQKLPTRLDVPFHIGASQ